MSKTRWNEHRLERLFERYNRIYWWHRRLPRYRVTVAKLDGFLGLCHWRRKHIEIDTDQHRNDRHIRRTLLHEMVHAATRGGHDLRFFAQMERLLRRGALPTIETGDVGRCKILDDVVPRRFPLLRAKVQRLESRRAREVERMAAKGKWPSITVTNQMIIDEFGDCEAEALPWKKVLACVGYEYGLTDAAGRPKNAWARRIVARGKKVHAKAHRDHLQYEKMHKQFEMREQHGV